MRERGAPAALTAPHDARLSPLGRRRLIVAVTAVALVALDQLTKTWALAALDGGRIIDLVWTLRLRLTFNPGAAFSLGSGSTWVIAALATIECAVVAWLSVSVPNRWRAVAYGLIVGAAVGNLSDRFFRDHDGAVVDFIDVQWWPVFNVADMGISAAVVMVLLEALFTREPDESDTPSPGHAVDAADR